MERVQDLIDKLYQQRLRNEGALQLLPTVQQLYDALLSAAQKGVSAKSEKVAVVMPSKPRVTVRNPPEETAARPAVIVPPVSAAPVQPQPARPEPVITEAPAVPVQPVPAPAPEMPKAEPVPPAPEIVLQTQPEVVIAPPSREQYILQKPAVSEMPAPASVQPEPKPQPPQPDPGLQANLFGGHLDAGEEAPTLQQHQPKQPPKEIHELISEPQESLNDRLKQERTELAHVLKDAPIKDLRKAIGVNDKFLFVSELFRGDEAMYERSIKTINSFHIFPEAEYWINRELKVKLGWNDYSQTVKHFYNLVRRRFS